MTTTIELEVRIEQLELELDEASDKIRELTEERDELQRRNGELEEKVDSARDVVNELARDLNR
ncbi:hypothetical protein OG601_47000 [Streptomyces sp. NBC_01239]|uniref:hypothetical protein n=1 Tax=Streptomyces sp. NBC_01239 TaxID=2903792 RepID=UPI0022541918|nr:hypothetical protein [Streptomyces sp. NBC_01239]MCX4809060.1 hypothetical protein [Streptomyces sp. NBC_01239]MCX4818123.1 hypothetical protein [Streptomyces sp. NBC_01239]